MRIPCSGHTVLNADGNVKTRWISGYTPWSYINYCFPEKKEPKTVTPVMPCVKAWMKSSGFGIFGLIGVWFWYYEGSLNGLIVRLVEPVISQVSSSPSCWGAQSRAGQLLLSPEYCGDWRMMPDWLQSLKSYTSWLYLILYIWDVGKWDFHEIRVSRKMLE